TDPSTLLTGQSRVVATYSSTKDGDAIAFLGRSFLQQDVAAGVSLKVIEAAASPTLTRASGTLQWTFASSFTGATLVSSSSVTPPSIRWVVKLALTGPVPQGTTAPAKDADVPAPVSADQTATSSWISALAGTYRALSDIPLNEGDRLLATQLDSTTVAARRLDASATAG